MKFWDLLYKRYSNPLELLQQMLQTGQLEEFIEELVQIRNEEMQEDAMWQYYLHTVCREMSFEDFMKRAKQPEEPETIEENRMVTIVKDSLDILARQ